MNIDIHMLIEMMGYISSALVLISFLMSSVVKLRVINAIGAGIFTVYALLIHSYPTALMNACLVGINIYYLVQLSKNDKHFDLIDASSEEAFVKYFFDYYKDDMETYFPDWRGNAAAYDKAYVVCADATPAGILLGKQEENGTLGVLIDYSVPTYRDCSVGKYLYSKLPGLGVEKLVFEGNSKSHEAYLKKMGFGKENNRYTKALK